MKTTLEEELATINVDFGPVTFVVTCDSSDGFRATNKTYGSSAGVRYCYLASYKQLIKFKNGSYFPLTDDERTSEFLLMIGMFTPCSKK